MTSSVGPAVVGAPSDLDFRALFERAFEPLAASGWGSSWETVTLRSELVVGNC